MAARVAHATIEQVVVSGVLCTVRAEAIYITRSSFHYGRVLRRQFEE
jgi:hypothetical protein